MIFLIKIFRDSCFYERLRESFNLDLIVVIYNVLLFLYA